MKLSENLQNHHTELTTLAFQIVALLDEQALSEDARAVRDLLSDFLGKLRIHLAIEDKSLYPRLLSHPNDSIREKARALLGEMGDLKASFANYAKDWPTDAAIRREPGRFVSSTQEIFYLLYKRMKKEDHELHPMLKEAAEE